MSRLKNLTETPKYPSPLTPPPKKENKQLGPTYMQRDEIDEKYVASPRRHHVEIGEGAGAGPVDGARLDGFDPEGVSEEHAEDGDTLVVIRTGYGTGDVAGDNGDHRRRD